MSFSNEINIAGLHLETILFNHLPVGMIIVEKSSGKVIYVNKRAIEIYGVDPLGLEMPGPFKLLKLNTEVYPLQELATSRALLNGETVRNQDLIIQQSNSKRVIVTITAVPIKNEKNEIIAALIIFEDITERRQIQEKLEGYAKNLEKLVEERTKKVCESEQSYRELYESFGEAFIATDWELNVIHWNKVAERVTRVAAKDALGKKIYDVLPEMVSVDITPYFEALQKRKPARFMMNTVSRETGREAVFEISTYPATLGIIIIVEDKTEEEQTKRLSAIGQTAGMVGHDIRNPLQTIVNELYLARQAIANSNANIDMRGASESIDIIQEQVEYINKIVSDLQDYARPLKPEFKEAQLSDVITSIFQTIVLPEKINIFINVTGEILLKTDPVFIRRALTNLAYNAIQAMPHGGILELKAYKKENKAFITVSDTGSGIPEEIKPKIFTPLFTTKAKGQGLGLAVVKRLVEALSGTITFESQEGKGTKFIIELPLEADKDL
jgi:PAS domain S-box-containing protein